MDINLVDGSINKFIYLERVESSPFESPSFENFGAVYHDVSDYRDFQPYLYTSLLEDGVQFMTRVAIGDSPAVDWNQKFNPYSDEQVAEAPLLNSAEPSFIVPDPK